MSESFNQTPKSNRMHISFFGRTNSGKSTIINTLTNQQVSIVSPVSGTTTDPVYKPIELLPIGPVVLIDTAGLDDASVLGEKRTEKTMDIIKKTDLAILVVSSRNTDIEKEKKYIDLLKRNNIKTIVVVNKFDNNENVNLIALFQELSIPLISIDGKNQKSMGTFKGFIIKNTDFDFEIQSITEHLVKKGYMVLLVAPQDIQAPKGRLILPQVQIMRDLLDNDCKVLLIKTQALESTLADLKYPPDLVIVDSQIFPIVNKILPKDIPLTSFSILMSQNKGDIRSFIEGAKAIRTLKAGDKVLIMEACTHHVLEGDIARVKLPQLINDFVGAPVRFEVFSGQGFPENINDYKLIFHCGGCMLNRKNLLSKINDANSLSIPITNFGIAMAYMGKILDRICF